MRIATGEDISKGLLMSRVNVFLGRKLKYAGAYPDRLMRLFKKGYSFCPKKGYGQQDITRGKNIWFSVTKTHYNPPTFRQYLALVNLHTNLIAAGFREEEAKRDVLTLVRYAVLVPLWAFFRLYVIKKGFLDGFPGFIWTLFSSLYFPIAYFKYWERQ